MLSFHNPCCYNAERAAKLSNRLKEQLCNDGSSCLQRICLHLLHTTENYHPLQSACWICNSALKYSLFSIDGTTQFLQVVSLHFAKVHFSGFWHRGMWVPSQRTCQAFLLWCCSLFTQSKFMVTYSTGIFYKEHQMLPHFYFFLFFHT